METRGKKLVSLCSETVGQRSYDDAESEMDCSSPDIFDDDSDADPDWSPQPCDSPMQSLCEPPSSPLTKEQIEVSAQMELILGDYPNDEQLSSTKDKDLQKKEDIANIRQQIAVWKEKRKEADRLGKRSQVRRLSRKIKSVSQEIIDEVEEDNGTPHFPVQASPNIQCPESSDTIERDEQVRHEKPKRKRNYCLYCNKLVSKFGEHLERCHPDKPEVMPLLQINSLLYSAQKKRVEKMKITYSIKKKWNSTYNNQIIANNPKEEVLESLIPLKRSRKNNRSVYVLCKYCDGLYSKRKLSVHLKTCSSYITAQDKSTNDSLRKVNALKEHSMPVIIHEESVTPHFKNEILQGINVDKIMETALNDPLIMKFGSEFHESRREPSSKNYVIREIRDLARLYLEIKTLEPNVTSFKDCLNPSNFFKLLAAVKKMSGYNEETGVVNVPSVAYRLTQPLKDIAKILKTEELSKVYKSGSTDKANINAIDDFLLMLQDNWSKKIGRICTKAQKFSKADRQDKMALESDIIKAAAYIESQYGKLLKKIETDKDKYSTYDFLMHLVVAHIMLLIRRRPVDFKHANLKHYGNLDKHDDLIDMAKDTANSANLTPEDFDVCKKFHIFFVPGKNLEIVPMVLTPIMKSVLDSLLKFRSSVGIDCETFFVLSKNRLIQPNESIKMITKKVTLKRPKDFTGNGLRHQAATFSKLHASHPQYQDFLASALGHTLSVHKKHYDLPMGVLQKMMVCPILHNIMTGKSKEKDQANQACDLGDQLEHVGMEEHPKDNRNLLCTPEKDSCTKTRWTKDEEHTTLTYFAQNIIDKVPPRRGEVVQFLSKHKQIQENRTIAQVYMYVRNHCNRTQKNVTPKIKRHLKLEKQNL